MIGRIGRRLRDFRGFLGALALENFLNIGDALTTQDLSIDLIFIHSKSRDTVALRVALATYSTVNITVSFNQFFSKLGMFRRVTYIKHVNMHGTGSLQS